MIDGANVKEHERIVLESGNPEYSFLFAVNVNGADIKAHEAIILTSDNDYIKNEFAKFIEDLNDKKTKMK